MSTAARSEPTEDELRAAYERCRTSRHTTWPATFEEAMATRPFAGLIRLNAKHAPSAGRAPVKRPQPIARPLEVRPLPQPGRVAPGHLDRKRAAAGDRDD